MGAPRPSLFMMAACIGDVDPWVLTASSGTVRLAPLRLMSLLEQRALPDAAVLLDLRDLGCIRGQVPNELAESPPSSPLGMRSDVVLMVPWSLLPSIAELEGHARMVPCGYEPSFAPEDWLPAWHHFIDTEEMSSTDLFETVCQRTGAPRLPSAKRRRYVLGTVRRPQGTQLKSRRPIAEDERNLRDEPRAGVRLSATSLPLPDAATSER